jgi:hypothetical protein
MPLSLGCNIYHSSPCAAAHSQGTDGVQVMRLVLEVEAPPRSSGDPGRLLRPTGVGRGGAASALRLYHPARQLQ